MALSKIDPTLFLCDDQLLRLNISQCVTKWEWISEVYKGMEVNVNVTIYFLH